MMLRCALKESYHLGIDEYVEEDDFLQVKVTVTMIMIVREVLFVEITTATRR